MQVKEIKLAREFAEIYPERVAEAAQKSEILREKLMNWGIPGIAPKFTNKSVSERKEALAKADAEWEKAEADGTFEWRAAVIQDLLLQREIIFHSNQEIRNLIARYGLHDGLGNSKALCKHLGFLPDLHSDINKDEGIALLTLIVETLPRSMQEATVTSVKNMTRRSEILSKVIRIPWQDSGNLEAAHVDGEPMAARVH